MEGRKEVRKSIIQLEWEHNVMKNKMEDLTDKMRGIKMLRLSEDQQDMTVIGFLRYYDFLIITGWAHREYF